MNILRIVYDWPDVNNITEGLAPAPYELSISQTKLGHKVYVLCGNLNKKNFLEKKFHYELRNGEIEIFNLPRALGSLGPFLTTSVFVIPYYFYLKFTKHIDIIHNHGHMGVWLMLYKYIFGFLDRTPVVGHYHIVAKGREVAILKQNQHIPFMAKYFEYPLHKLSDSLMGKVSSHIVTVSQDNVDDIKNYLKVNEDKITLLESGVDTDRFSKKGDIPNGFNDFIKDGNVIIANGGRLSKRKNIDLLVESLKHLDDRFKLVLWGKWDSNFQNIVNEIIEKNNLSERVLYVGPVSYFDVDKYYRVCNIFCLPSSYEGFPKVVLEALATECLVIASGFKINNDLPNLSFLDDISSERIAEKVKMLNDNFINNSDNSSLVHNTELTVNEILMNFSWDSKARKLDEIYKKVVN